MNLLVDRHHSDLFWSLQLLAERLGGKLYTPHGIQWYDEGYFGIYGDLRRKNPERFLAKQYLVDTIFDSDGSTGISRETYNGCYDYPKLNLLTFEQIKNIQIDIVICTLHENEQSFAKLKEFYPNAKFIRQVGNDLDTLIDESLYPNLLSSATAPFNAFKGHKVLYRQEWDTTLCGYNQIPTDFKNIYSFQNDIEQFEETWTFWTDLKHKLRDYKFQSFGVACEQGKIYPKREYFRKMLEATFIVQSKGPWEGYGHVLHNAMWLGRPMILKFSDYAGKMAEPLLIKDETYLEMTDPDIIEKIKYYSEPERFLKMSERCRQVFRENIDFDKEWTDKLKPFFDNLV